MQDTVFACMFVCAGLCAYAGGFPNSAIQFIENKGQWEPNVLFRGELPIGNIFIEKTGLTYLFVDKDASHKAAHGEAINSIHLHAVKVKFIGSNPNPLISKDLKSTEYYNYFKGDETHWASNVYGWKKVVLHKIYPGIDMELLAQPDGLKINFMIAAGADASLIKLQYDGASKLDVAKNRFKITTSLGEWIEEEPVSYQTEGAIQRVVQTDYVLNGNTMGYRLGAYNKKEPITIDPTVIFGTYIGSAADNFGFAASYDALGNAYGAGTVYAANFPTTTGAFDITFGGGSGAGGEYARDAFIAKFNPTGSQLIFASFLGGTDNEQPHSVSLVEGSTSGAMDIFIYGTTESIDFPTTLGAFDRSHNGKGDLFVCKLNSGGNTLLASTYFGGSQDDGINGDAHLGYAIQTNPLPYNYADWFRGEIIPDLNKNIIISSCTRSQASQGLPLINAVQGTFGGGSQDGLLLKLNNSLSNVIFCTYVGGNGDDALYSVSVNFLNEIIVGGGTTSSNLLYPASAFSYNGAVDGFIGKFSGTGSKQKVIYTGTAQYDQVFFVQTDNANNIYSMGQTTGNMTASSGVYKQPNGKQFIQKYDENLNGLILQTVFGKGGGQPELSPSAFLVDNCGRVYISGWGGGTNNSYHQGMGNVWNLPVTPDAFQSSTDGSDFYLMVLSKDFGSLVYASFYGGESSQEHVDGGTSHFDKTGIVYQAVCAGCNGYSDFPTTPTAYSRTNPSKRAYNPNYGGCNLALFKFDMRTYLSPPVFRDTIITITAGSNLVYDFSATDAGGDIISLTVSGDVLYKTPNPATITDTVSTPGLLKGRLKWQTRCEDATGDTVVIYLEFDDNACPNSNITDGTIKVVVISKPVPPPYPDCIRVLDDNSVQLKWTINPPAEDFAKYMILRTEEGKEPVLIDSINTQSAKMYNDIKAYSNFNTNYCYKLVALNTCRVPGDTSRTICSIYKEDSGTVFTGIHDTLIYIKALDSLNQLFVIGSVEPKDSVFINMSGTFVGKGAYHTYNGVGSGAASLHWRPTCDDILKDTLYANIVVRNNQCPVWKTRTKVVKLLVTPMDPAPAPAVACPRKMSNDSFEIDWAPYQTQPHTTMLYLIRVTAGSAPQRIMQSRQLKQVSFFDNFKYDPAVSTCYYLTSSDSCGYFGDTSRLSCIQNNSRPAPDLSLYTVTVVDDKVLALQWQSAAADSFWHYQVFKQEDRLNKSFRLWKTIDDVNDTTITDDDVIVDEHSYCYKIVNIDLCGNKSIDNPVSCSILLTGKSFPFSNSVGWLPYDYWSAGVSRYEIFKTEPGWYTDKSFALTAPKTFNAIDNNLNYDNGLYDYTVVAYENNGFNASSRSNTVSLVQAPLLYTPNAYTENSDGLNDVYHMVPVFVKEFYLQIYNRWGERVFETHDKKAGFNSTYKGKEIQEDVYFYIVTYTGWDQSSHTLKGNFTILR